MALRRVRIGRRSVRRRAGFTLLEAIVALVVLSVAGGALYGLFGANLLALGRSGEIAAQSPVVRHALARLAAVNAWQESEGAFAHDGFEVAWRASLAAPVRWGQGAEGAGYYDLGLYDVEVAVHKEGRQLGVWRTRLVGYHNARGPAGEPPWSSR